MKAVNMLMCIIFRVIHFWMISSLNSIPAKMAANPKHRWTALSVTGYWCIQGIQSTVQRLILNLITTFKVMLIIVETSCFHCSLWIFLEEYHNLSFSVYIKLTLYNLYVASFSRSCQYHCLMIVETCWLLSVSCLNIQPVPICVIYWE